MGTRADFYVGRNPETMEWLGSIALDGYPSGIADAVKGAATEAAYRLAVAAFLAADKYATAPDQGWPWPWDCSDTTDYAYTYDENDGRGESYPGVGAEYVWAACFGRGWWLAAAEPEPDHDGFPELAWPDMSSRKRVTMGPRSGLIVLGGK